MIYFDGHGGYTQSCGTWPRTGALMYLALGAAAQAAGHDAGKRLKERGKQLRPVLRRALGSLAGT